MPPIDLGFVLGLYDAYQGDLARVQEEQRASLRRSKRRIRPRLDDIEAEITYLLVRWFRPKVIMELGVYHGWSTTWLLSGIRDNGIGHLYSFDVIATALSTVPASLAEGRWTFRHGDVRDTIDTVPDDVDHLFIDAAHSGRFARWYVDHLLSRVPARSLVSVHDVFHGRRPLPHTEGAVLLNWLASTETDYFTPSPTRAPGAHRALADARRALGIHEPIHSGRDNPMVFFLLPDGRDGAAPR